MRSPVSDERIESARRDLERLGIEKAEKKALRALEFGPDQDDNFAYIVGYTPGGAPYGVTWEEWDLLEHEDDQFVDSENGAL